MYLFPGNSPLIQQYYNAKFIFILLTCLNKIIKQYKVNTGEIANSVRLEIIGVSFL